MENPLLAIPEQTNDTFIPFDKIKNEHFEPAFEAALQEAKENLEKIISNPEAPTFENTIEALEYCSDRLEYVEKVFMNLKEANTSDVLSRVARIILPKVADFTNDIVLSSTLFERTELVQASPNRVLNQEEQRLLELRHRSFIRNGALLDAVQKERMRVIDAELELLKQRFEENLLKATNAYQLIIRDERDLSGIPERVRELAREEAHSRGVEDGWAFTLKSPSFIPFMEHADSAALRKELWVAYRSRCMSGGTDNREIVKSIIKLRKETAVLLGHKTYAHFALEDRMAKTPEAVLNFFALLQPAARTAAEKELEELRNLKKELGEATSLDPWDVAYYANKLKIKKFSYREEELRPYLALEDVLRGIFEFANKLYGITATVRTDIPVYHSDVTVYEIRHERGVLLGFLYLDLFPRDSKRQGGWIDDTRVQEKKNGKDIRPHMFIVCNFTKPTKTTPSLLSSFETETLFHEFGHGLQALLSDCTYASLSGLSVPLDFVELSSQLYENWMKEKEGLRCFARHYQTGAAIPADLVEKMQQVEKFDARGGVLSQLGFAVLDMGLHGDNTDAITDVVLFENEVLKPYRLFEAYPGTSSVTSFKHIFGGEYQAGYYSYHWSEVLASDAFEYFKEKGIFSKEVAEKFREHILSKGNTEESMELYKKFRGREPDPKALLRSKGLL